MLNISNLVDDKVNDLVKQIDPDYEKCQVCEKFFHKKVFNYFSNEEICPLCLTEIDNKKHTPIDKIEKTIKDFEEEYQKNPNFLNFEQN